MKRQHLKPLVAGALVLSQASAGATLHVAPNGNDAWSGTQIDQPFATLERARAEIQRLRDLGKLPPDGLTVLVRGGCYRVTQTFTLTEGDSGTAAAPIFYRAYPGETPIFQGGVRLTAFQRISDPSILARLPEHCAGEIRQVDLKASGVASVIPFKLGGFASGSGFHTYPVMELFCDGRPLPRSRWPNDGYERIAAVSSNEPCTLHGLTGSRTGPFTYAGDRPARWLDEKYALLRGYWFWDWADSYERIAGIDPERREITLAPPHSKYGYRQGQRYAAVNLLCEIDEPGEWYIDEASGMLYVYPPSAWSGAKVELSVHAAPFVRLEDVSHVTLQGLTWELGATDGLLIKGGERCRVVGCTIRRCAGNGVEIRGGTQHELRSCDISSMGRGGAIVAGGDRRTLTPGGHVVENCHIYELSRVDRTYTPAVLVDGVGQRIAHNLLHDIPSSAIRLGGNDHVIEFNEVFRVVRESDDQGGTDMFGDPTFRGNIFRYNYWHHIGRSQDGSTKLQNGRAGIRLDDAISGVQIEGNIFFRCGAGDFGGVQIHGGKDNSVTSNLFVECPAAVSFSSWGDKRWRDFTATALQSPAIKPALYRSRYPALASLADDHDRNLIAHNLIYRCAGLLLHATARNLCDDNIVTDEDPGFVDAAHGNFALAPRAKAVPVTHFDRIGLYPDADRATLPTRLVQDARAEP